MAASDARPVPRKGVAYRVTFPILDADGDLVTGAAGLDSEISKDGGTFADCTNEATEIATSSGMYYLELTSTEMNADTVAIIVKTSTAGAKTTPIVMYPEEAGDYRADVTHWLGTAAATPGTAGVPSVDVVRINTSAGQAQAFARWLAGWVVGTSDSGTTTTMVDAALTSAVADIYKGWAIHFSSGTNLSQMRLVTGFDPATDTVSFTPAVPSNVTTENYVLVPWPGADLRMYLGSVPTATPDTIKSDTAAILIDTAEIGTAGAGLTNINLPNQTMDIVGNITGNLSGSVGSVTGAINTAAGTITTLDALDTAQDTQHGTTQTAIADVPTVAEFEARTLATADYFDPASDTVTVGTSNDKTGYRLSSTGVDDILDEAVEGTTTLRQSIRLNNAAHAGKLTGAGTTSIAIRDLADSKDRVAATVDSSGNRSAVTVDLT